MKTPKLVCFDLDDTLIYEKHSVMIPCIMNKKEFEHDVIQKREETGEIDYKAADYLRASLLKGLKESNIKEDFLNIAKPIKNIKETIRLLQQQGAKCIIITVGSTDIPLFNYCGRSIAINSSESVKNEATYWIDTDDLLEIVQFI